MKREILLRRHDLILMPLKLFILEFWKEKFLKKILERKISKENFGKGKS
jgi:hypothetical protein